MNKYFKNKKGFTLIELLIVIAVLGTLAVVVLIALNPVQQLARTRDAGRDSTVAQLGRAMEARGTVLGGQYPSPTAAGSWIQELLVNTGEISIVPGAIAYPTGGGTSCGGQNGFCYATNNNAFVIYAAAEADSNTSQCTNTAYFVYSSSAGRGGLACLGSAPTATTTIPYVQ